MAGEGQHNTEPLFELVYEGPSDDAPRTLQLIKGVFVAELNFPIPEVQRILEQAPATVASAPSESALKEQFSKLKSAGARVLIVKRTNAGGPDESGDLLERLLSEAENGIGDDEGEQESETPPAEETDISFEFDLDIQKPKHSKHAAPGRVYDLDIDASESPEDLMASLSDGNEVLTDISPRVPPIVDFPSREQADTPPETLVVPNANDGLTLLGEDELRAFHVARGGAIEEANHQEHRLEEENAFEDFESSLMESLTAGDTEAQSAADLASATVTEVALVLSEVSSGLEAAQQQSRSAILAPTISQKAPSTSLAPAFPDFSLSLDEGIDISPPQVPEKPKVGLAPAAPPPPPQAATLSFETDPAAPAPLARTTLGTAPTAPLPGQSRQKIEAIPASQLPSAGEAVVSAPPMVPKSPIRKSRSLKQSVFEFGLPIIIGTSILASANWVYFAGSTAPAKSGLVLNPTAPREASSSSSKRGPAAPTQKWMVIDTYPDRRVEARIQEVLEKKILGLLNVTSPAQRSRSNEEIARGVKLPPWLKRFEAANLLFKSNDENPKKLMLEGPAFFYIEYEDKAQRFVGKITASALLSPDDKIISLNYEAQLGTFRESIESTLAVLRTEDGSLAAFVSGELELNKS